MTNEQINYRLENYLRELDKSLAQIPMAERSDIILELNGHITESLKTKSIDEVLNALGKPEQVANRYLLERGLQPIPKKRGGCFKWGCLGVAAFFLVLVLAIVLLVRGFFPLIQVNDKEERVRILGGLIDVDGVKETVKIGGLINVADDDTPIITKKIPVSEFTKITLQCSGDVEISQGTTNSVEVRTTQKNMERVLVSVNAGMLSLGTIPNNLINTPNLAFSVTLKNLDDLLIRGSGNIMMPTLQTKNLRVVIEGSGNVQANDLHAKSLVANVRGSGDVLMKGIADDVNITIKGSGDYKGDELESQSATIDVAGSGSARVWAKQVLNVHVAGSGDVYYKGKPAEMNKSVAGSGSVEALD